MNGRCRLFLAGGVLILAACRGSLKAPAELTPAQKAAVHRNLGKASFDNCLDLDRAAEEFRTCLQLEPDVAGNHLNLAMVYLCNNQYDLAVDHLTSAEKLEPDLLAIPYNRGLIYKRQQKWEEGMREFEKVLENDPDCVPCLHQLALCQIEVGEATDAIGSLERVIELDPNRISAYYTLFRQYIKTGERDKARATIQTFRELEPVIPNSERSDEWLEKSRYSEVVFPPSPAEGAGEFSARFFVDLDRTGIPAKPSTTTGDASRDFRFVFPLFFDADGDGDPDLLAAVGGEPDGCLLYVNDGDGNFEDMTASSGIDCSGPAHTAVAGDLDNDGDLDLFIGCDGPNRLFRNRGDGTFEDVTEASGLEGSRHTVHATVFDADHDSDLDLLVADAVGSDATQSLFLYQNQGTPDPEDPIVFRDVTGAVGLPLNPGYVEDSCFADFDRNGGTDLYLVIDEGPNLHFANLRGGRFAERAAEFGTGLTDGKAVEVGDINADGHFDLLLLARRDVICLLGSADGTFHHGEVPPELGFVPSDILLRDFDNSGDLDLLVVGCTDPHGIDGWQPRINLFRGRGDGSFEPTSQIPSGFLPSVFLAHRSAAADMDGDCDLDILLTEIDGDIHFLWNDGAGAGNRIRLELTGTKGNRDGIGSRIEVYADTFRRTLPVTDTNPCVPIGHRDRVDALTILWPSGIVQSVTHPQVAPCSPLGVIETPAEIESCPSLYVETADGMAYVTDLMGTSALGLPTAPGSYLLPDAREVLKIEGPVPDLSSGRLRLVMAQELCEIVYLDAAAVEVWDHPEEITVISDLRFSPSRLSEDRILALSNIVHPISAKCREGVEWAPALRSRDLRWPEGFQPLTPTQFTGLTQPYTLELDFGPGPATEGAPVLVAYGHSKWTSENLSLALFQNDGIALEIPTVEVQVADGSWNRIPGEFAFPALRPKSIAIPLPQWENAAERKVRISTNLLTFWDEIYLGYLVSDAPGRRTLLTPGRAVLGWHGYSRQVALSRDYERSDDAAAWLPIPGRYTPYGEVTASLLEADDTLAVYGPGETLTLDFPTRELPPLEPGWTRDYFLITDGWTKGNSYATGGSGGTPPIPHREMTEYPFPVDEGAPGRLSRRDAASRLVSLPVWAEDR